MINSKFFIKKQQYLTISQIVMLTNSKLLNDNISEKKVFSVATIDNANDNDLTFLASVKYISNLANSKASCCFIEEKYLEKIPNNIIPIINPNPYFAYSLIAKELYQEKIPEFSSHNIHPQAQIGKNCQIAPTAYVGKGAIIGDNCYIAPSAVILDSVTIGNNCFIHSNTTIAFSEIGNNCIIHSGVKIGQDGFGFANHNGVNYKLIQLGIVKIGNDVEIGSNTCIDRGTIDNTVIFDNVKIDNLCQIAHNVVINKGSVLAGCTAIAGSTKIGQFVQIGGGCCINGHITIGDFVKIAAMSGVMRDVASKEIIAGIPAQEIRKWHKTNSFILGLADKKNKN